MTPEERERRRLNNKRWRYFRDTGKPCRVLPEEAERARNVVRGLHERGMSYRDMSIQCGRPVATLNHVGRGTFKSLNRGTYNAVMSLRYAEPELGGAEMDPTGTARRLRALWAEGFPAETLAVLMGSTNGAHDEQVRNFLKLRQKLTHKAYADRVAALYEKYAGTDPRESAGVTPHGYKLALTYSARHGCAPSICWDEDTIDDPDAIPEWTGACGSNRGYQIHRRKKIAMCGPCHQAHADYQQQLRDNYAPQVAVEPADVRELLDDGMDVPAIAAELDCSTRTIQRIMTKEGWHSGTP